jgi:hypothetical protein
LINLMRDCKAYSHGTAEALQEFKLMQRVTAWDTLEAFDSRACVFYEATPQIFRGLVLLYITICFNNNSHNQTTSDSILFDIFYKKNGANLSQFSEQELETVHRWIGWLVFKNNYRYDYSPVEMLQIYTTLLTAQATVMLANASSIKRSAIEDDHHKNKR